MTPVLSGILRLRPHAPGHLENGGTTLWAQRPGESHTVASRSPGAAVLNSRTLPGTAASWAPHLRLWPRLGWVSRGGENLRSSETQALEYLFAQARSTLIHGLRGRRSLRFWLELGMKKCCRLVDISCNYNLYTCAYWYLHSQGLWGC